jgi:hypothetical protein
MDPPVLLRPGLGCGTTSVLGDWNVVTDEYFEFFLLTVGFT